MNHKNHKRPLLAFITAGVLLLSGCGKSGGASSAVPENSKPQSAAPSSVQSAASSAAQSAASSASQNSATSVAVKGAVGKSDKVEPSYLDDAVFIGDSVSLKLKNIVTAKRKSSPGFFGKAQFLAAGSMGSGNALEPFSSSSIHPSYNGKKALLEDNVAEMGAKKVYIMLGMNDLAVYGIDKSVQNMDKLLSNIKAKSPNVIFYVQSATPMIEAKQMKKLNNASLAAYNVKLSELCKEKGYSFLDIASVMRDSKGNLLPAYCSDPDDLGVHFTDKACDVWIDYILTHTVK
jgi:lysophospholipase L1-like esterase